MKYAKDKSFAKKSKLKKELAAEEKKRLAIALEEQRVLLGVEITVDLVLAPPRVHIEGALHGVFACKMIYLIPIW